MDIQADRQGVRNSYLLLMETPQIIPENGVIKNFSGYRRVFTWNDDLVDGEKFIKINFPNFIKLAPSGGFSDRDRFCVLIASNKSLAIRDSRDLYVERVKAIRWFEKNAPHDFDLYGAGWNLPKSTVGLLGKANRHIWNKLGKIHKVVFFPSYKGRIDSKCQVLSRAKFSICYENVRDLPGYITEKIFDCFISGCVPVYWGASNINEYIPADCFIDRRAFESMEDLYRFLKAMTEGEFVGYQQRISNFLASDAAYPFSSEFFAETIVSSIVRDLERAE
uniref:Fucosyltransferase C-terminal domain-containing protein n=2 Tax=Pseudomonas chaetocerotis TaxID=2758695 RepID=A0A931CYR7_9PSED